MSKKSKLFTSKILPILLIGALIGVYYIAKHNNWFSEEVTSAEADFVEFIDVGQGDCALIYSNGQAALIDTGTFEAARNINKALEKHGIKDIDVLVISHLHDDHAGGIKGVFEFRDAKNVIMPEISTFSDGLYLAEYIINKTTKAGGGVYSAKQGMNFKIGDFELTVLLSLEDDNENNRSIVVAAEIDNKKFIFSGDGERMVENALLDEGLNLKCDVFKAGHHGSNTSNTYKLLKAMNPEYVAISVGADNLYGHPHSEVLERFGEMDIKTLRTDKNGNITFNVKNGELSVKTER